MVNNGLQQGVIHLGLIKPAQQEHDRLTQHLAGFIGADVLGQQVHEPVAGQKLSQAHHAQNPLKNSICG